VLRFPGSQRWILWWISTLLIAAISLAPSVTFQQAPSFTHADKIAHFLMYGTQAALLLWALELRHGKVMIALTGTILLCTTYGILMEWLQTIMLPNDRYFSMGDIVANIAGVLCFSSIMCANNRIAH